MLQIGFDVACLLFLVQEACSGTRGRQGEGGGGGVGMTFDFEHALLWQTKFTKHWKARHGPVENGFHIHFAQQSAVDWNLGTNLDSEGAKVCAFSGSVASAYFCYLLAFCQRLFLLPLHSSILFLQSVYASLRCKCCTQKCLTDKMTVVQHPAWHGILWEKIWLETAWTVALKRTWYDF